MAGAIILAGGESSRIGSNKALLDLDGKPLIQRMTDSFKTYFDNIYLVSPENHDYQFLDGVIHVKDIDPENRTILQAIYSGMIASEDEYNFVCACDMPYLNLNLIKYLFSLTADFDAIVPIYEFKPQTMHTIYKKTSIPLMEKTIHKGKKKINLIFRDLNVKYVPQEAMQADDPKMLSFFHIRTYIDYMLVQKDF